MEYKPSNYDAEFGGKVAIVTGAASGIGKAIATALVYHNATVCIFDADEKKGIDAAAEILERGKWNAHFYHTDVSDRKSVRESVEAAVRECGIPWILVNNAGIEYNDAGNLITMPYEKMMNILNTNLLGQVHMLREVVPYMEKNNGGRIVNISSVQATRSCLPGTIYQVTKQGVLGLARVMSLEYARRNIRANTVSPGGIKTEGMGNARIGENPHALDDLIRSTPLGRRGHPEEIANVVLFLLSEGASYINGQEIVVDGGLTNALVGDMKIPKIPVADDPDKN